MRTRALLRVVPALALALPATGQQVYSPPQVNSPNPATTHVDNVVEGFPFVQTSPLDMITKNPLVPEYTLVQNGPRGRMELYYQQSGGTRSLIAEVVTPRTVVSMAIRPASAETWFVDPHARADNLPQRTARGAVLVWDGARNTYTHEIHVGGEPAGLDFTQDGSTAFVACADTQDVYVIDTATKTVSQVIDVDIFLPRALTYVPATGEVVVASHLSGNGTAPRKDQITTPTGTTITSGHPLRIDKPMSPDVPLPDLDLVVLSQDPVTGAWSRDVTRDVTSVMTVQNNLTAHPARSRVFVMGTDALNETRGERNFVGGQVAINVLATVDLGGATPAVSTLDLGTLGAGFGPVSLPTDLVISPVDNQRGWLVARGVDKVVEFDLASTPPSPVGWWQIQASAASGLTLAGARTAAISPDGAELAVYCEIEGSYARIDVSGSAPMGTVVSTQGLTMNPMPLEVQRGMAHASDTRLSANGSTSCLTCHVDGDHDGLAWDLAKWADPEGTPADQLMFERDQKGPMLTQTLHGMPEVAPYHWRGEQRRLDDFNGTFADLMETAPLPAAQLEDLVAYMNALRHPANPRQAVDRDFRGVTSRAGTGDAFQGQIAFLTAPAEASTATCASCHQLPTGTNNEIQNLGTITGPPARATQVAHLRGIADRLDDPLLPIGSPPNGLFESPTRTGTGLLHSGGIGSLLQFVQAPAFPMLAGMTSVQEDLVAFMEAFDTGLAPATGYVNVVDPLAPSFSLELINVDRFIQKQSNAGHADFIALITLPIGGNPFQVALFYDRTQQLWIPPSTGLAPQTPLDLETLARTYLTTITFLGTPPGEGHRRAIDADGDELLDYDEPVQMTNPFLADTDGDSRPDGAELVAGDDPTLVDTSSDAMVPTGSATAMYTTTNTAKVDVKTSEPTRILSVSWDVMGLSFPVRFVRNGDDGGFARQHVVTLQELPYLWNLAQFLSTFGVTSFDLAITLVDPAGNSSIVNQTILTVDRGLRPLVIQSINVPTLPTPGSTTVNVEVTLAQGTISEYLRPLTEGDWRVSLEAYYGNRSAGPGSELTGLVKLTGPAGASLTGDTASTGPMVAVVSVPLPAGYATDPNPVLGVTITDVVKIPPSPPMSPPPSAYIYVETQSYSAFHTEIDL